MKSKPYNIIVTKSKAVVQNLFFPKNRARASLDNFIKDLDTETRDNLLILSPGRGMGFLEFDAKFPTGGTQAYSVLKLVDSSEISEFFVLNKHPIQSLAESRIQKKRAAFLSRSPSDANAPSQDTGGDDDSTYFVSFGIGDDIRTWSGPYRFILSEASHKLTDDGVKEVSLYFTANAESIRCFSNNFINDGSYTRLESVFDSKHTKYGPIKIEAEVEFPVIRGIFPTFQGYDENYITVTQTPAFNYWIRNLLKCYINNLFPSVPRGNILPIFPVDLDKSTRPTRKSEGGNEKEEDVRDESPVLLKDYRGADILDHSGKLNSFGISISPTLGTVKENSFETRSEASKNSGQGSTSTSLNSRRTKVVNNSRIESRIEEIKKYARGEDGPFLRTNRDEWFALSWGTGGTHVLVGSNFEKGLNGSEREIPLANEISDELLDRGFRSMATYLETSDNSIKSKLIRHLVYKANSKFISPSRSGSRSRRQLRSDLLEYYADSLEKLSFEPFTLYEITNSQISQEDKLKGIITKTAGEAAAVLRRADWEKSNGSPITPNIRNKATGELRFPGYPETVTASVESSEGITRGIQKFDAIRSNPDYTTETDKIDVITKAKMVMRKLWGRDSNEKASGPAFDPLYKFVAGLRPYMDNNADYCFFEENDTKILKLLYDNNIIKDAFSPAIIFGDRDVIKKLIYPEEGFNLKSDITSNKVPDATFTYVIKPTPNWDGYQEQFKQEFYSVSKRTSSFGEQPDFGPYTSKISKALEPNDFIFMHNVKNSNVLRVDYKNQAFLHTIKSLTPDSEIKVAASNAKFQQTVKNNETFINKITGYLKGKGINKEFGNQQAILASVTNLIETDNDFQDFIVESLENGPSSTVQALDFLDLISFLVADDDLPNPGPRITVDMGNRHKAYASVIEDFNRLTTKADIRTLPFFNHPPMFNKHCFLFGLQNSIRGSVLSGKPLKSVFTGRYNILEVRHFLSNSDAFSEFKLSRLLPRDEKTSASTMPNSSITLIDWIKRAKSLNDKK